MTREDAFIADIIANPNDDAVRLIYADWLDGQGREEHGAFIRTSIAGKTRPVISAKQFREWFTPFWCKTPDASLSMKRNAGGSVVAVWRDANGYGGGVRRGPEPRRVIVRRGFVAEIRLSCQEWLVHGPALVRRQPIEEVVLTDREPCHNTAGVWVWGKTGTGILINWPGYLPKELYDLLSSNTDPISFIRGYGAAYPTESAALDALSTAALLWARQTEPATTSA